MATLILGTVGRAIGGPLGGLAGSFLGSTLDRSVFGSGKTREGPRLSNLTVQSAAYGEALPRLYGRMRVAGNLVWTAGIREAQSHSGSRKRGTATNSYGYSASFAVVVAGRAISRVGRIWADGKLLRGADGGFIYPAVVRTYLGGEDQPLDPLIAAAEGIDNTPAYRGRAYVVFDDLPLADYGNRIPNLTFEVVADAGDGVGLDVVARDLCAAAAAPTRTVGTFSAVQGFAASRSGTARQSLAALVELADLSFGDDAGGPVVRGDVDPAPIVLPRDDLGATADDLPAPSRRDTRAAAGSVPDALTVGFNDPARDFQLGLQRAVRRTPPVRSEQRDFDAALEASDAKRLAERLLRRAIAARTTGVLTLPWRYAGLRAGDVVRTEGDSSSWRVRGWSLVGPVVELAVERLAAGSADGDRAADAGRAYDPGDAPPGATVLRVLDLPPLAGPLPMGPRLWLAAAGTSAGWRRADVVASADGGASYAAVASIVGATTMGSATSRLEAGNCDRWDRRSTVDVALIGEAMWLDSLPEVSVLAGGNLALVGDEIIQFASAVALGDNRFRLSDLLRGRRGTEAAAATHGVGERFVLLDQDRMVAVDPAIETIGTTLSFKAAGEPASSPVAIVLAGRALRPWSPVAVTVRKLPDGSIAVAWKRRSRAGIAWLDHADAPLGEEVESYRLTVALDGRRVREVACSTPGWSYPAAMAADDGIGAASRLDVVVVQLSATVGVGLPAACGVDLAAL